MTGRIICLVGTHPRSTNWPLEMEPGVEFWAANEAISKPFPGGLARAFQLHPRNWREAERRFLNGGELPLGCDPDCFGRSAAHVEALRACQVPVNCIQKWDDIPTAVEYPRQLIADMLGVPTPDGRLYATSTFGYMMALALFEHTMPSPMEVAEIRLAGMELAIGTARERAWEWPNLAFYLGMAHALGIKITLPPGGTSILNAPLYAVDGPFLPEDPDHWWGANGSLRLDGEGRMARL